MDRTRESAADSSDRTRPSVDRRQALLGAAGLTTTALAGCLGSGTSGSSSVSVDSDLPCFESSGAESVDQPLPAPVKGDPEASVTVAAYEDFACPHCRDYVLDVVPEIRSQYIEPGEIRYEHHDFPIPVSEPESYTGANAARAAQARVGDEGFWVTSKQLFENQDSLGEELYSTVAEEVCLDSDAVSDAATNRKYKSTVTNDRQRGIDIGVEGTPTVFVDGSIVESTVDAISSAIESAR